MIETATVVGHGIAAYACASLLRRANVDVYFEPEARRGAPVVLLSTTTQILLRDVFQGVFENDSSFPGLHRIERRVVRWGPGAATRVLPHTGAAMAESDLVRRIAESANFTRTGSRNRESWTVLCSRTARTPAKRECGERIASAVEVDLAPDCDPHACYVESAPGGWLFLLPFSRKKASFLSVGGEPDELIEQSSLVSKQIRDRGAAIAQFSASPAMAEHVAEPFLLACGAAALSFDPLCGEGMGHSLREAILASALIRAASKGASIADLLRHYETTLTGGFKRHLEVCQAFYSTGGETEWWKRQAEATAGGISWASERLNAALVGRPPQFRLVDFELEAAVSAP